MMRFFLAVAIAIGLAWLASRWKSDPEVASSPAISLPVVAAVPVVTAETAPHEGSPHTGMRPPEAEVTDIEAGADPVLRAKRDEEERVLRELRAEAERLANGG